MNRFLVTAAVTALCAMNTAWARDNAAKNNTYRKQAEVQLELHFQGVAEGQLSRGLHFFGRSGHCQAWYDITNVLSAPGNMNIRSGDRLQLQYRCNTQREYVAEAGTNPVDWMQADNGYAKVWLQRADIKLGRLRTWTLANPDNRFAPTNLADGKQPAAAHK